MKPFRFVVGASFYVLLATTGVALAQYDYYPNRIEVIPSVPISSAATGVAQFTVVVPVASVRYVNDIVVQPRVSPAVAVSYNVVPPYGGTIDVRMAFDMSPVVFTGQTYDFTAVPVLVAVRSPGPYTINYFTKSTSVMNDPYALKLSRVVKVIASDSAMRFALENPQPNSYQSGIGVISGWACAPRNLNAVIDSGPPVPIPGGGSREDTAAICGHAATGFGLLINFNNLMAGPHTLRLESPDPVFVSETVTFNVTLPQAPATFIYGLNNKEVSVPAFPVFGKTTTLIWQQSLQNFTIKGTQ